MNKDLLYKKLDEAKQILGNVHFGVVWHLPKRKEAVISEFHRLKSVLAEAELLLSSDANEVVHKVSE